MEVNVLTPVLGFKSEQFEFLSNFYTDMSPIKDTQNGITIYYPTSEHMYQAYKSTCVEVRVRIASLTYPGQAKRRGRTIRLRSDWDRIKDDVMYHAVYAKFSQPILKEKLLGTGQRHLYEINDWGDDYWGCDNFLSGENRLGEILMRVREDLRNAY